MSRDRRNNRDGLDAREIRRASKQADKKHGRSDFRHHIKDSLKSNDFDDIEDTLDKEKRPNRR